MRRSSWRPSSLPLRGGQGKKPPGRRGWADGQYSLWHMPNALKIHGKCYPISTDFRTGLRFWNLCRRGQLTGSAALTSGSPGSSRDGEAAMEASGGSISERTSPWRRWPPAGEAVY